MTARADVAGEFQAQIMASAVAIVVLREARKTVTLAKFAAVVHVSPITAVPTTHSAHQAKRAFRDTA